MRLAVIADIHGNVLALEAVLADLARERVDALVDLGDRVSGPLWPRETYLRLEELGARAVRGNHDRQVAETGELGDSDRYAAAALNEAQRAALAALPFSLEVAPGVVALHASAGHDDRYTLEEIAAGRLRRATPETMALRLAGLTARTVLLGHSHRSDLVRLPDGRTILNPGSVGCPAYRDPTGRPHVSEAGSPHARYAIVEIEGGEPARADFRAVAYDCESAARRAEANGRADWAHALRTGRMPPG